MSVTLQTAKQYAALGWKIIPLYGIREDLKCRCGVHPCSSPGKHPIPKNGVYSATCDLEIIDRWFSMMPRANIGLATGLTNGFFVIDVDGDDGENTLNDLQRRFRQLPATVEQITGNGRHLFFKTDVNVKNSSKKLGPGLDVRGDGGYVVVEPSLHHSGRQYQWEGSSSPLEGVKVAEAPEWLLRLVQTSGGAELQFDSRTGPGSRNSTLTSLVGGWVAEGHSFETVLMKARQHNRDYFCPTLSDAEVVKTVKSVFKTDKNKTPATTSVLKPTRRPDDRQTRSDTLLDPPGCVGAIADWITATAISPQPVYSVNAALAAMGTICGQMYATESGLRSNLYIVDVGPTASGKEHPRNAIKTLLVDAGLSSSLCGEDIRSGKALTSRVSRHPTTCAVLDEFGLLLQATQNTTAHHQKEIMTVLMKLFSASMGYYSGSEYADQDKEPDGVWHPVLVVYGSTTGDSLMRALKTESFSSGFANRFLFSETDTPIPEPQMEPPARHPVPSDVLDAIRFLRSPPEHGGNIEGFDSRVPRYVKMTASARQQLHEFKIQVKKIREQYYKEEPILCDLWGRCAEHAEKVALVLACGAYMDPVIEDREIEWAIQYVRFSFRWMERQMLSNVSDSEFERNVKRVLEMITNPYRYDQDKRYTDICAAGYMPEAKIKKTLRISTRDLHEVLGHLIDTGEIGTCFLNEVYSFSDRPNNVKTRIYAKKDS